MEKIKIDPFVSDLLYDHDCVIIADFGGFVANYKSSYLHPAQHTISPPSKKIAFNSSLKMNDGLLASYIAENNSITYLEACKLINKYVEESLNLLETGRKLQLDKIGSLFYNSDKNLQFSPDLTTNYLHDSFGLTAVHSPAIMRDNPIKKSYEPLPFLKKETRAKTIKKRSISWKWMELIPAAAVLTLLLLNPTIIQNLNDNVAGLLPEMHISNPFSDISDINNTAPEPVGSPQVLSIDSSLQTASDPTKTDNLSQPDAGQTPVDSIRDNTATSSGSGETSESPEKLTDPANVEPVLAHDVAKEITTPDAIRTPIAENTQHLYYIVAGCFKIEENAVALHQDLLSKGYASELIGKIKGLHVVTFQHSASSAEAHSILEKLREKEIEGWVLKH